MKLKKKQQALELRKNGFSIKEIVSKLGIAQSTASLWSRNVRLDDKALARLRTRVTAGQYASAEKKKSQTEILNTRLRSEASDFVKCADISEDAQQMLGALIYWCEGVKEYKNGIAFTNSDPLLTRLFINLMANHFSADRSKFLCRLHLHEYHDDTIQKKFWSSAVKLPLVQFQKTYLKPHTGVRYRDGYPGCISVRYYDNILARKVMFIAQEFIKKMGA